MAEKKSKNLIMWICAIVAIIAVVVVAIILGTRSSVTLNDSYFESDDTKYVITVDAENMLTEGEEYVPVKSHLVYFYSGNDITSFKTYNEYANADTAQKAYEYYKNADFSSRYENIEVDGKYLILTNDKSDYEGTTANDIKQQIELIKMYDEMEFDEVDTEDASAESDAEVEVEE